MKKDLLKEKKTEIIETEEIKFVHRQAYFLMFVKILTPFTMLVSGLILLALRLAGWSIIIGLPLTIIGIVLLIYAYDDILSKRINHNHSSDEKMVIEEEE